MDSIYQSSHFKDAYRGCEVLSIREEAINFTLFFTEDATERDIVNVIRMSAALQEGNATSQVVQVDQLILDLKDRRVNLVKVKEVESFTKIRSQPAVTHPADMSVQQGTRHTDQTRTAANAASTAPSDGKTGRPSSSTASPKDPCNPCQGLLSGVFPHPSDCRLYVQCLQGRSHVAVCGSGLKFSAQTGLCDVSANCAVFQSDLICPALVNLTSNPDGRQCDNVTRDLVAHESLCDLYYQCQHGTATLRACPTDSVFDPDSQICKSRSAANNCTASNGSRGGEGSGTSAQTGLAPPPTSPSPTPPQYDYPSRPAYDRDPCKTEPEVGLFPHPDDCGLYFLCSGRASQTVACPDRRVYLPSAKTCVDVSPGRLRCPDLEPCKGRDSGYVPHPHDCARFLQCRRGHEEMLSCPEKFVWNPGKNTCEIRSEKSVCPPARESTGR